jgi:hypothetical protein
VLLGAGASKNAGVPTSFEMTQEIVHALNEDFGWKQETRALNFICGALAAYDAAAGGDPYRGLDVERVFAAVELLARRKNLEVTPFVAAWHPAVDSWDRRMLPASWDRNFAEALLKDSHSSSARDLVLQLIRTETGTSDGATYRELMKDMVSQLVALISTTRKQVSYLESLVAVGRSAEGITIATLNYDLSIEHTGANANVPVHTGIQDWIAEGTWRWSRRGVRLLKLHGSIDWRLKETPPDNGRMGFTTVEQIDAPAEDSRPPALVFGHGGKLRATGPFLSLLAEFETQLSQAHELLIVGYSFRDDHVNEVIRRWLAEDDSNHITVVDPHFPTARRWTEHESFRDEMIGAFRPRLGQDDDDASGTRLTIIRQSAADALRGRFAVA